MVQEKQSFEMVGQQKQSFEIVQDQKQHRKHGTTRKKKAKR